MNKSTLTKAALSLVAFGIFSVGAASAASPTSAHRTRALRNPVGSSKMTSHSPTHSSVKPLSINMPNLQVASLSDSTLSTGATLFYFPQGAIVNYDARGGSVASAETTLLDPGSYSNRVDGIVLTGGSTMGLSVGDGVRAGIFKRRASGANAFDAIPSIPTAVVYDFGGRIEPGTDPLVYPDHNLGLALLNNLKASEFLAGRAGAGTTTTVNKIGEKRWGGQGAAFKTFPWGSVFVAVVLNAMGDVYQYGQSATAPLPPMPVPPSKPKAGENTTLSIVVTDVKLDPWQLKRLSVMVHTSMADSISPFHTYYDGDINFAASNGRKELPKEEDAELVLQMEAAKLMKEAILTAIRTANPQEEAR